MEAHCRGRASSNQENLWPLAGFAILSAMLKPFKAIFFDAGGTLLHPFPSVGEIYRRVAAQHGCRVEAKATEDLFRKSWLKRDGLSHLASHSNEKVEKEWWRGLVFEVFETLLRRDCQSSASVPESLDSGLGGFKDFEAFFDELYDTFARPECWKLYPGTLEVLAALKQQKKCLGIISNWDSRLLILCKGLGLEDPMDFILASAVFGASKPNPKIFEEALRRAGVPPEEAVHIGDSFEDDIKGARGVGMNAILIERHPQHRKIQDVPTIHDLKELMGT
jgi:putative hydrolase of the HAD superfamily